MREETTVVEIIKVRDENALDYLWISNNQLRASHSEVSDNALVGIIQVVPHSCLCHAFPSNACRESVPKEPYWFIVFDASFFPVVMCPGKVPVHNCYEESDDCESDHDALVSNAGTESLF